MFNTTKDDFYIRLLGSSSLNKLNTTISIGNIKLDLDRTTMIGIIAKELMKQFDQETTSRLNRDFLSTTRLSGSYLSPSSDSIHNKIDNIVVSINLCQMLFGILGNLICICILMQKTLLNRRFNLYLLFLAIADFSFCVIVFINYYIAFVNPLRALYDLSKLTCYFTDYIVGSIDAFCVFLTLILSIDRLYAIKKPIKSKVFFTYRFPKRIALSGYLFILFIKSPEIFLSQRYYGVPAQNLNNFSDSLGHNSTTRDFLIDIVSQSKEKLETSTIEISLEHVATPSCNSKNWFQASDRNGTESPTSHLVYIIYCNIIIPLVFNIIPALAILILNLALWFFMRQYTKIMTRGPSEKSKGFLTNYHINRSSRRTITTTQKSHYFTIIILGFWLLLTNIPYYTFFTYYWAHNLRLIQDTTRVHLTIQAISSAFFNSNHCINIIIYMIFNRDFRLSAVKILFNIFNLNPLIKLNPMYFKVSTPQSSVRVLNSTIRLKNLTKEQNFTVTIDDFDDAKSVHDKSIKIKSNLVRSSFNEGATSYSTLNLNAQSNNNKLLITNKGIKFFKLNRKK